MELMQALKQAPSVLLHEVAGTEQKSKRVEVLCCIETLAVFNLIKHDRRQRDHVRLPKTYW